MRTALERERSEVHALAAEMQDLQRRYQALARCGGCLRYRLSHSVHDLQLIFIYVSLNVILFYESNHLRPSALQPTPPMLPQRLRQLESRRALIEGAQFLMHRPSHWGPHPRPVMIQYIEAVQTLRILAVPPEEGKGADPWGLGGGIKGIPINGDSNEDGRGGAAGEPFGRYRLVCSIPASSITGIELGITLFPAKGASAPEMIGAGPGGETSGAGTVGFAARFSTLIQGIRTKQQQQQQQHSASEKAVMGLPELKCLSLVLAEPGLPFYPGGAQQGGGIRRARRSLAGSVSTATDGGSVVLDQASTSAFDVAVHLQVPAQGNGRSRDEWAHGLSDLMMQSS